MAKWDVRISATLEAKTAAEATDAMLKLFECVGAETPMEKLVHEGECFDYSATVSVYGD